MGEILIGAALAAVLHRGSTVPRWAGWLTPVPLAAVLLVAVTWPAASGPAYSGWLPVFALGSALLIWGLQVDGPVRRVLSLRPVVWVGTVSYGIYLYHWPIFAVVTADRTSLDGVALAALRVGLTVAAAALSYRVVERPIRSASSLGWRPITVGVAATAAVALIAVVMVPSRQATLAALPLDSAAAAAGDIEPVSGSVAPLAVVSSSTLPPAASVVASLPSMSTTVQVPMVSRPVRIVVVGDSTAEFTAAGLVEWAADHPDVARVRPAVTAGCGFLRDGRVPTDGSIDWVEPCRLLLDDQLPAVLAETQPDVVMLMVTMRDVENRIWDDAEGELDPFDPRYRARLLDAYRAMAERLVAAEVPRVAWVLPPKPIAPFEGDQRVMRDPARYAVQHDVIRQVAAEYPDVVRVVDLDGWLTAAGRRVDTGVRPDGLHWSPDGSYWVSDSFLAASLVSAAVSP
jgi:hypothetical protein